MAAPIWQDVINIAPGDAAAFTALPVGSQTAFLAMATAVTAASSWGALQNQGIVYLAAHLAKLGLLKGAGAVTEEQVGQMSRTYATVQGLKGSLGLTSYGAEYARLIRLLPTAIGAIL